MHKHTINDITDAQRSDETSTEARERRDNARNYVKLRQSLTVVFAAVNERSLASVTKEETDKMWAMIQRHYAKENLDAV